MGEGDKDSRRDCEGGGGEGEVDEVLEKSEGEL